MNTNLGKAVAGLQLVLLFVMVLVYVLNPDGKSAFTNLVIKGSLTVIVVTTIWLIGSVMRDGSFSSH